MCDKRIAVLVKDLCFSYNKTEKILNNINLSVNYAQIYGLLGPSGCGKTTLLKCILGRIQQSSGEIKIFGSRPGTKECGVPGPAVGYMPQDLSLCMCLTIEEILTYFGKLFSMNKIEIKEKFKELTKLLGLPQNKNVIAQFSGGQKRRISMACALIHSPSLLILDEPTVGTDPLLKKAIWHHLETLCDNGVTIILTTHYIEEARNANVVAFMRNGQILAEDDPNIMLHRYGSTNLEEVFLKLCSSLGNDNSNVIKVVVDQNQNQISEKDIIDDLSEGESGIGFKALEGKDGIYLKPLNNLSESKKITSIDLNMDQDKLNNPYLDYQKKNEQVQLRKWPFINKCSALLHKNFRRLTRSWIMFLFFILFPSVQFGLFMIGINNGPTNLNLAIFNEEANTNVTNGWGQLFVDCLDKKTFNVIQFNTYEEAIDSVDSGQTYAFIEINRMLSKALRLRFLYGVQADEETLEESQIYVHIDWTNQIIALQIERNIFEAMQKFAELVANETGTNPESLKVPLSFEKPRHGKRTDSFRDYVLPGAFVIVLYSGAAIVSTNFFIEEMSDGILERTLVAGILPFEYLFSYVLTQFLMTCIHLFFMLMTNFFAVGIKLPFTFVCLALSQGVYGIAFGMMTAILFPELLFAALFLVITYIYALVVGGLFWPFESLPMFLKYCGLISPHTLPIQSLRNILYREWDLSHTEVYSGFIVTYLYIAICLIISLVFFKKSL